jgi:adenylate cyclase
MTVLSTPEETLGGRQGAGPVPPQSRLTAIVLVDAAGSTLAMNQNEVAALREVERALDVFAAKVEERHGRVLNTTGDGALAVFESVASAVAVALEFQQALPQQGGEASLGFRAGVHLGEVFEERGRAYGDSLNIAERIQSAAPVGGICVSDLVYRAIRGRPEFSFEYLGAHRLKSLSDEVELYRVHGSGSGSAVLMKASPRPTAPPAADANHRRPAEPERPSIAVLPFRDLSDNPGQDYFADGVTDDIITSLSRFRGIDLIARGSSFALRDRNLPVTQIGAQLGARYVAQGSIRRSTNRVRVVVELSDTATARMIWAERYDRPLEDIFEIQEEISTLAVGAMSARIEDAERDRVVEAPPDSLQAYGCVLMGQGHLLKFTAADNLLARQFYERALLASPKYARAFAGLSRTHNMDWRYSWSDDPATSLTRAYDLAVQAVATGANDARGYAELGYVLLYRKEHERSLAAYRRALAFNPNDADIIAEMADTLVHAGRSDEALPLFERAMRLNPFYPDLYLWYMAGAYLKLRRFEEAIECVQRMNNVTEGRRILACCYAHLGQLDEARREASLIRAAQPTFSADQWAKITPDRRSEDLELFISGLRMAGL